MISPIRLHLGLPTTHLVQIQMAWLTAERVDRNIAEFWGSGYSGILNFGELSTQIGSRRGFLRNRYIQNSIF